ncbi:MAG: hypothetical protein ABJB11_12395 [Ferruginibacter sp.]
MKIILYILLLLIPGMLPAQTEKPYLSLNTEDSNLCISTGYFLEFVPVDNNFHQVKKKLIQNLDSAMKACGYNYRFDLVIKDFASCFLLPVLINQYAICVGNNHFYISFEEENDSSVNSIVLFYDILNEHKNLLLKEFSAGTLPYEIEIVNGTSMYLYKDKRGDCVGEIFLKNNMTIAYYTKQSDLEPQLRYCIRSFKFE